MDKVSLAFRIGFISVVRLLWYKLKLKSGYFIRILPIGTWKGSPAREDFRPLFSFSSFHATQVKELLDSADLIMNDKWRYFGNAVFTFTDWHRSPYTGIKVEEVHWSLYSDFDSVRGDIKWFYEGSRFEWIYVLGRAYLATSDSKYLDKADALLVDWIKKNPPNSGILWRCAQECGIRVAALLWLCSLYQYIGRNSVNDIIHEAVLAFAERISTTIGYSLAQKNNHTLCESLSLFLVASSFPDHPKAKIWGLQGERIFTSQIRDQFFRGGFYGMNSFMYARCALRWSTLYLRVKRSLDQEVDARVRKPLEEAAQFMASLLSPEGYISNYGTNDGSHLIRFCSANFFDFRPAIASLWAGLKGERVYKDVDCVEEDLALWGFGPLSERIGTLSKRKNSVNESGGYYSFANESLQVAIRAHNYSDRPAQADLLNVDLWFHGVNLLRDSGTYSYCDRAEIGVFLSGGLGHNSLVLNKQSQMKRVGRFLWASWPKVDVLKATVIDKDWDFVFVGQHDGFLDRFGVICRRYIFVKEDKLLILDKIVRTTERATELLSSFYWRLGGDQDWQMKSSTSVSSGKMEIFFGSAGKMDVQVINKKDTDLRSAFSQTYSQLEYGSALVLESKSADLFAFSIGSDFKIGQGGVIFWENKEIVLDNVLIKKGVL